MHPPIHTFLLALLAMAASGLASGDPLTPQATWSQYGTEIYVTGRHSVIGSYDHRLIEVKVREAMKDNYCASAHFSASYHIS
jgi:hypothetical protein